MCVLREQLFIRASMIFFFCFLHFRMSNSELNQLQLKLSTIQKQQRLQTLMIKQFQNQLEFYEQKHDDHSPLDLSSTSSIEFQMESQEGEPENPNMSKVCEFSTVKIKYF